MASMLLEFGLCALPPYTTCWQGGLSGGDLLRSNMTVRAASAWCSGHQRCAAFTTHAAGVCSSDAVLDIKFRDSWGAARRNKNASFTSWLVGGPRPPPPMPPIPPDPCQTNVTNAPRYHLTNLGIGPHDVNSIFRYRGVYHVMHQANWTDWAHLVSTDLAHWTRIQSALSPNGDWDGALTILNGKPIILFDCYNVRDCRPQNDTIARGPWHPAVDTPLDPSIVGVARPADYNDANLSVWRKDPLNPIRINGPHAAYAGPSTLWEADGEINMLMSGSGHTVRYTSSDARLHDWVVADPSFAAPLQPSGPSQFFPLSAMLHGPAGTATSSTPDLSPTHVFVGLAAPRPHRSGSPWYVLGTYDRGNFTILTPPAPLDASDVLIYAIMHPCDDGRMLFMGWFNVGSSCLTVPREIRFDPVVRRLTAMPVAETAQLRQRQLGSHMSARLRKGDALELLDGHEHSTSFDLEMHLALPKSSGLSVGLAVLAASVDHTEVLAVIDVSAPSAATSLRAVNVSVSVPFATNPAFNSTASFMIPDAPDFSIRALADRAIVELFVASGHGVVSTPVLAPGLDNTKSNAFVYSMQGKEDEELVVLNASVWGMGCCWARYP